MIVHVGAVCSSHFNYPLVLWCSHVSNVVRPQTVQFDLSAWGVIYRNQSEFNVVMLAISVLAQFSKNKLALVSIVQ